jgi:hypothetical protein
VAYDNCPGTPNPDQGDCNSDGIGDACEIAEGSIGDINRNGIPDSCECLGDVYLDSQINGSDLGALLSQWGRSAASTTADFNADGRVDGADLGIMLINWGLCPN